MRTSTTAWSFGTARWLIVVLVAAGAAGCGSSGGGDGGGGGGDGGGGGVTPPVEQVSISGLVIDGYIEGAVVCIDLNRSGRCDSGEASTRTETGGAYKLSIPKDSTAPLVADVIAGTSRDTDEPGAPVDVSYRMASPSVAYGTNITPFSTLVHLTHLANYALAEDLVRDKVGLPPKHDIRLAAAPAAGSLTQGVSKAVVKALKATSATLDMAAPGAMATVVAAFPPALTDLPTLRITTKDGAPIVSTEDYVDATFLLTNPAVSTEAVPLNGKIRGRGHSTWGQPKNPYKIQFSNDAAYAKIPDFLGMKKNRNWALLADYFDRTLMRNKLAFSLGSSVVFADGIKWTPSGQHVEVYLNEDYAGVYLLNEDIRIDPARLDIRKMSKDLAANEVDGGYIFEVDYRLDCYNVGDLNLQYISPRTVRVCISKPDEADITQPQLAYAKNLLATLEADVYDRKSTARFNTASVADWYLINELFRNNDSIFFASVFMWKDTDTAANPLDRLVNLGPLWDFDISAGNINYNDNWKTEGCWVSKDYGRSWIAGMLDNPAFVQLTLDRWKAKRPALAEFINASIDTYSYRLDAAQQRNFARWPIFGVPMFNYYTFSNYAEEVAFLRRFLNDRMVWLDKAYASPEAFASLCK
jgi:hypothetical protein